MPAIILPDRWRRQPTDRRLILAPSNQIARGITAFFDPFTMRFGDSSPYGNATTPRYSPDGVAANVGITDSKFAEWSHDPRFAITGDISIGVVFDVDALGNYSGLVAKQATATTYAPFELRAGSGLTDSNFEFLRATSGSYKSWAGSGNRLSSGQRNVRFMVTAPSGIENSATGYLNGIEFALSTGSGAGSGAAQDNGASKLRIGTRADGVTFLDGGIYLVCLWNRRLSSAEAIEWTRAPYQIFGKPKRILYFTAPSGGGATIAGALESLTLSTFGATVGSARAVAAALESLALTTSAARVSSDRAITASVESISITTSPARIASDRAVAAATEQLTVTPATASVALVSGIAAGTEALSVTANPATVALAASIAATLEAITVTGLTATVSTSSNTNISAALESITVTVNPATVSRNTALAAALESLTVTPHAASIAVGQIVAAALESLTLTSYPAGIALDVAIAAQLEQINLTTLAAQVGLGTNVAALTEALTLTPHGATLTFAPSVGAATEYITLTTFAAVVGATEAALLSPGLEFTIPLSRLGYTIPLSRVHFTIPQE